MELSKILKGLMKKYKVSVEELVKETKMSERYMKAILEGRRKRTGKFFWLAIKVFEKRGLKEWERVFNKWDGI